LYGKYKAKIKLNALSRIVKDPRRGKLVLVTAMTPTKSGEGKTTVAIGLAQALCRTGKKAAVSLRQPSLGPVFGKKGGATGGGMSHLVPSDDINLHFNGDFYAVAAANNLLAAMIDNHLFHGNQLELEPESITLHRALDMNDRALRDITINAGTAMTRQSAFDITAASEVMAIVCLSRSFADLKRRLGRIVVGRNAGGQPVTANDLGVSNAMAALLVDAVRPNIVQTCEGTPAFVHGGPFANIAHGCSSILSSGLALRLCDLVVTEAGFGADLGFEKFCDIVAAQEQQDLVPDVVVIVATIKALKLHGGAAPGELIRENVKAAIAGLSNLDRHVQIVQSTGLPFVVAVNKHGEDTESELAAVQSFLKEKHYPFSTIDVWNQGGSGAMELAGIIDHLAAVPGEFSPFLKRNLALTDQLQLLCNRVYGGGSIALSDQAKESLTWLEGHGFGKLPVCVAKTQYSLSDDPHLLGAPTGFTMTVSDLHLSAGAGFVVARMGEISTMPGLPAHPNALSIDVDDEGRLLHLC
jgi:formate--tetrahydrofolate ligase